MQTDYYTYYTQDEISKIGNAIIYFSDKISKLSKTKLLKLLYILDEISIKRSGIPALNLKFKIWKFGPVSEDIFIELSSEASFLKKYIHKVFEGEHMHIEPGATFDDSEFTQNDIDLMDFVIEEFGNKTAKELVDYTHRKNSPWYNSAKKYSVLEMLTNEQINNTEFVVDMSDLVKHDERKLSLFEEFRSTH